MAKQSKWKYCIETTENHTLATKFSDCIALINEMSINEGAKKTPFTDEKGLNLDKIESICAQREKRDSQKTMDISFGIKDGNNKEFVLCEFRLNFTNPNNIKKRDLELKIDYSKRLLGNHPVIHNKYLFIFPKNIKCQADNRLRRLFSNKSFVKVLDIYEMKSEY